MASSYFIGEFHRNPSGATCFDFSSITPLTWPFEVDNSYTAHQNSLL